MSKQMLTGLLLILTGRCVRGDDGPGESYPSYDSLAELFAGSKDNCPERQNSIFCHYWDPDKPADYPSAMLKSKQSEEKSPGGGEELLEFPDSGLEKRFLMARRRSPTARGYKRGPGFRSWGGKRDSVPRRQDVESRAKFGPWGGKRDGGGFGEKRAKFQSWGGKRGLGESADSPMGKRGSIWKERLYYGGPLKKDVPKRPLFQSWGGKRAPWGEVVGSSGGGKRKFSSWGGKREVYGEEGMRRVCREWEERVGSEGVEELCGRKGDWEGRSGWGSGGPVGEWGEKGGEGNRR